MQKKQKFWKKSRFKFKNSRPEKIAKIRKANGQKGRGLGGRNFCPFSEKSGVSVSAIPRIEELAKTEKFSLLLKEKTGGGVKIKIERKFFCFGYRRSEAEAGGNAERKPLAGITARAERASVVGVLLKMSSDFIQNTPNCQFFARIYNKDINYIVLGSNRNKKYEL